MTGENEGPERRDVIREMPLFANLSDEQVDRITEISTEVAFSPGEVIVDQGDPGTACYVIVSGTASVYVRGEYVTTSGRGSMIGEIALVDHRPRTATVLADSDLKTLQFNSDAFRVVLEEMPQASEQILRSLRARLDRLDQL